MRWAGALAACALLAAGCGPARRGPDRPPASAPPPRATPPRETPPPAPRELPRPPEPAAPGEDREAVARAPGEVGIASFYAHRFHGRRTASGARYDMHAMTCAHPTAPFGTKLKVTDLESGRSVVVTVNDRGPFARGRVVDLSLEAAKRLGMIRRGLARVRVERLAAAD